jgi:hypothetical protein
VLPNEERAVRATNAQLETEPTLDRRYAWPAVERASQGSESVVVG